MSDWSSASRRSDASFTPAPVDKESPLPLYYQIRQSLLAHIARLHEGDTIPPEQTLCELFGVSRPTVRQAIADLVQDGLLRRTAGRGTFVTSTRVSRDLRNTFDRFDVEMHAVGRTSQTEVLACEAVGATDEVATSMGVARDTALWRVDRRRFTDDASLVRVTTWLPADLVPALDERREELSALRHTLEHRYGLHLERVKRRFEAVAADSQTAELLNIPSGSPIQFVETHSYGASDRCVEFSRAWYRGDRASFVVEVRRDGEFTNI